MKTSTEFFQFQLVIDAGNVFIGTPPRSKTGNSGNVSGELHIGTMGDGMGGRRAETMGDGADERIESRAETMDDSAGERIESRRVRCNITGVEPDQLALIIDAICDAGPHARKLLRELVEDRVKD